MRDAGRQETRRLPTKAEFLACFAPPMREMTEIADPAVDIRPYVDAIEPVPGAAGGPGDVAHAYRDAGSRFDQVLVATGRAGRCLVVVDLDQRQAHGHHPLDLTTEHGG